MKKKSLFFLCIIIYQFSSAQRLVPFLLKNGYYVYVDSATMKPVNKTQFFIFNRQFSDSGLYRIMTGSHDDKGNSKDITAGFMNNKGVFVVPLKYYGVSDFKEGVSKVQTINRVMKNGVQDFVYKYGFVNRQGKEVVPPKYDKAEDCKQGVMRVAIETPDRDYLWGLVTKDGKELVKPQFKASSMSGLNPIDTFKNDIAIINNTEKSPYKYGALNRKGQIIIPVIYDFIYITEQGAICKLKDQRKVIDKNGKELKEENAVPKNTGTTITAEILRPSQKNGKWGIVNREGKEVIPFKYDDLRIADTSRRNIFEMRLNGKWGAVNTNNEEIIPIRFERLSLEIDRIGNFGYFQVMLDNKWGALDETGKEILPPRFERQPNFSEGVTRMIWVEDNKMMFNYFTSSGKPVFKDNQYRSGGVFKNGITQVYNSNNNGGIIDKTGKEIIQLKYDEISFDDTPPGFFKVKLSSVSREDFYIDKSGREYREQ